MSHVRLEREGGVALLFIDRPKSLNALNSEVFAELAPLLLGLAADPDLRCVVVRGVGGKAFVAGADISELATLSPVEGRRFAELGQRTFDALSALPVPVIAAVEGYCLGGGLELALACDFVLATHSARFGAPEVKLGLVPGFGGTQRLTRRVGPMKALELIATGRMIDAEEAARLGLCLDVVDSLDEGVDALVKALLAFAPLAVREAKRLVNLAYADLAPGLAHEATAFGLLFSTEDAKGGLSAFLARTPPVFAGR